MAGSQPPSPIGIDPQAPAPATPGPTGQNDAADPNKNIPPGDTPGSVGMNDAAAQKAGSDASKTDSAIEALDLSDTAKKGAYELKRQYPAVVFTSGRRDKAAQASAMASNVVLNRNWIKETYASDDASIACQKWVDDNKDKTTKGDIADGLKGVMDGLTDAQLGQLSKHLSGDAFDVQPVDKDADGIKKAIRGLPGLGKFLEKEGGLIRWHAQF
jgi:hypothetical protein